MLLSYCLLSFKAVFLVAWVSFCMDSLFSSSACSFKMLCIIISDRNTKQSKMWEHSVQFCKINLTTKKTKTQTHTRFVEFDDVQEDLLSVY